MTAADRSVACPTRSGQGLSANPLTSICSPYPQFPLLGQALMGVFSTSPQGVGQMTKAWDGEQFSSTMTTTAASTFSSRTSQIREVAAGGSQMGQNMPEHGGPLWTGDRRYRGLTDRQVAQRQCPDHHWRVCQPAPHDRRARLKEQVEHSVGAGSPLGICR